MGKPSSVDHLWHVWINRRQEARHQAGEPWEHSLYEFKTMLHEVTRLPFWLQRARTGTLPAVHQQCSRTAPEPIVGNVLRCALGVDVTTCPILGSLYQRFAEAAEHADTKGRRYYADVTAEDADEVAAKICCWHIFTTKLGPHDAAIDRVDGYVEDESDRMYWRNYAASMAALDADEEPE